jgi:hypothetical protein
MKLPVFGFPMELFLWCFHPTCELDASAKSFGSIGNRLFQGVILI